MNVENFKEVLHLGYNIKRPVISLGSPGTGKSAAVHQVVEELSAEMGEAVGLIEIRGASLSPSEVADICYVSDDTVKSARQDWVPTKEKVQAGLCPAHGIIFLDEIGDAMMSIQSTLQRLLLDRKLGSCTVADGWYLAAASNRTKDKAAAGRLSRALINRAMVITVDPDSDCFFDWGVKNDIASAVLAYVRFRPDCVADGLTIKKTENMAFCSPRSLHIVSDLLKAKRKVSETLRNEMIIGTLGDGVGSEFTGFLRIMEDLPDLNKIIEDPEGAKVPAKIDCQYATIGALHNRMDKKNVGNILKFFTRLSTEMSVVAIKDAAKVATSKLGDGNLVFRDPSFIKFAADSVKFAL